MIDPDTLDWAKGDGLLPAIVQDRFGQVRMLGYMSRDALAATIDSGFVTFFSRSKKRLWMKGESSGNRLRLLSIAADCDSDALLVVADAHGPTCHTGSTSCFGAPGPFFPATLESIVAERAAAADSSSYTARLLEGPIKRAAQKVGEEGVEVALAAVAGEADEVVSEAADLAFHLTILLRRRGLSWSDVSDELERRHRDRIATALS